MECGTSMVPQRRHPKGRCSIGCDSTVCVNERVLIGGCLHEQVWFRQPPFRQVMGGM